MLLILLTKMLKRNKLTKDEIKLVLNYKKNLKIMGFS